MVIISITVKKAQPQDYSSISLIANEVHEKHVNALPHIFYTVKNALPKIYFEELIENPMCEILVAKEGEDVVGFAIIEIMESPPIPTYTYRKISFINNIAIKKEYSRKGIGYTLFKECTNWSKIHGASAIELNVWEFNQDAIAFYRKLGMEYASRKMYIPLAD
ncbi:GNAT family N-acetyltransferase [Sutcliffiella cohnii]